MPSRLPINEADCARWLDKEPEPTRFVIGSYAPQGCVTLLIAEGSAAKEIAVELGISAKTVEAHRTSLMRKLGVRKATELVRYAVRHGLIEA